MNSGNPDPGVARALALSEEILSATESGNLHSLEALDRERMELLKSFRKATRQVAAADQALLQQIAQLNDRAIGFLEHRRRIKAREIDTAALGRRATVAYSATRLQR